MTRSGRASASARWISTASWAAASATRGLPLALSQVARSLSDDARSDRWASGRDCASARQCPTASSIEDSAPAESPLSPFRLERF